MVDEGHPVWALVWWTNESCSSHQRAKTFIIRLVFYLYGCYSTRVNKRIKVRIVTSGGSKEDRKSTMHRSVQVRVQPAGSSGCPDVYPASTHTHDPRRSHTRRKMVFSAEIKEKSELEIRFLIQIRNT